MKRTFVALAILLAASAAFPAVLYQSDFNHLPDGTQQLPGWTLTAGEYAVRDGWLTVKSERSNPHALLPVKVSGDFTFRAKVRGATRVHRCALTYGPYRLEVNNQFVRIALERDGADQSLAVAGGYSKFLDREDLFTLRLVRRGDHLLAFADSRKLFDYALPAALDGPQPLGLFSGWGSDLSWGEITVTDQADEREWPREVLPEPTGRKYVEVLRVRSLRDQQPDDNLYTVGQEAGFKLTIRRVEPGPVLLRFRVLDVDLKPVAEMKTALDPAEGPIWNVECSTTARRGGCFKVAFDAGPAEDHLGWVEDLGSFAVLPAALDTRPRLPNSFFGGHMDGINLGWHLRQARRLGVQWARCHDMMQWTWWNRIQPDDPDQWRWSDDYQQQVDALGFGTSGEFLWVPKWAQNPAAPKSVNPATYPPADLAAFGRYVYETVSHYKSSIHVWELWNEPHYSGFFSGTPEQYAAMLKVAYREAKRADPTCTVMGGGGVNMQSMGWIAAMLKAAGGDCLDAFSIHYLSPDTAQADMKWLHERLAEVGFKGPIINSEESVLTSSFLDQARTDYAEPEARYHYRNACCELVRTYMENLSNGIARVFYYELADPWRQKAGEKPAALNPSQLGTSLWDEDWMPRPVAVAHAALALAIDGKPFVRRIERGELQVFIFANESSATAVQYALYPSFRQKSQLSLTLPAGTRVMDFMGNERDAGGAQRVPLSREPLYVTGTGPDAAAKLTAAYEAAVLPR